MARDIFVRFIFIFRALHGNAALRKIHHIDIMHVLSVARSGTQKGAHWPQMAP